MKLKDGIVYILVFFVYVYILILFKPDIFTYSLEDDLLNRYFRSQDITHEVVGRVFLSDSEIHIAAGLVYIAGGDPTIYNFQHPPLIKYLYGGSIILFNNPFYIQILFGYIYLLLTYFIGKKFLKRTNVSILAVAFIMLDPLFLDSVSQALLDLGQGVLALLYVITVWFYPQNFIIQGIILGLFSAAKFWTTAVFFVFFLPLLKLIMHEKIYLKLYIYSLLVAFLVFSLSYFRTFLNLEGKFNIIFFQLKILKYWFNHSISTFPGETLVMFLSGYFSRWWGGSSLIRAEIWTVLWPISFINAIIRLIKIKSFRSEHIIYFLPIGYLLYLGLQAPFPRYFIIILPYLYLGLSYSCINILRKGFKRL